MAWTAPKSWTSGSAITAAELDTHVRDNEDYLKDALDLAGLTSDVTLGQVKSALYGARATRTSTQSIPDASDQSILYTTEDFDSNAIHSTSVNNTRLVVPSGGGGYYLMGASTEWEADATGARKHKIEKNGVNGAGTEIPGATTRAVNDGASQKVFLSSMTFAQLTAGDYIACTARQTSGGSLNVDSSVFWIARLFVS